MNLKFKNKKKGFTIVELVIVVAVIAILSAVLIPTFVGLIKKAKVAADTTLVKNVNTALAMAEAEGKNSTVSDALADAQAQGYLVEKLTPSQKGYHFVYDMSKNRFALIDEKNDVVYSDGKLTTNTTDLWYILPSTEGLREGYSVYLTTEQSSVTLNKLVGIEGTIGTLTIADSASTASVVVAGTYDKIEVNTPNATVNFNGTANEVNVIAVDDNSFHVNGTVGFIKIAVGRLVVETNATVKTVFVSANNVKVDLLALANVEQIGAPAGVTVETSNYNKTVVETTEEDSKKAGLLFDGGIGTEANPYIIANAEQMQNITKNCEVDTYFYKVKNGVTEIDCSNWTSVELNGSFDGNGVTFINLTTSLFYTSYASGYIKNFDIKNVHMIKNSYYVAPVMCYLEVIDEFTIENVNVSGYAESVIVSSFVGWGESKILNIKNSKSSLTLVSTGTQVSGFVGNTAGVNTVNVIDSIFNGSMSSTSNGQYIYAHSNYDTSLTLTYTLAFKQANSNLYPEYSGTVQKNPYDKFTILSATTLEIPSTVGEVLTVEKDAGAVRAVATFVVGVNPGNFTGVYQRDEIDLSDVEGSFETVNVKRYNVVINDGAHGTEVVGDTQYISASYGDGTYNCVVFQVVQYNAAGAITSIRTCSISAQSY